MNDHRRFQQLAASAIDFAPSGDELRQLDAHLRACVECRHFATGLQADAAVARARPAAHAPDRVRQTVVDAAYRSGPTMSVGRLLPMVAALVIVLALFARIVWFGAPQVAAPQLPSLRWSPLSDLSGFGDGVVMDVTSANGKLIAVGGIPHPAKIGITTPFSWGPTAVWASEDGLSWSQLEADPTFANAGAIGVAVRGGTVAMLGMEPEGLNTTLGAQDLNPTNPTFSVWLADAQQISAACPSWYCGSWQTVSLAPRFGSGRAPFFTDLVAGGPGFVAVGVLYKTGSNEGEGLPTNHGALVATSSDGRTWTFNDPTRPEFAGGGMQAVVDGPAGLVAVGDTDYRPSVWYSADGTSWTPVDGAVESASATIRAVAAGPSDYVAVGDDLGAGRSWVSADGRTWQTSPTPPGLDNGRMLNVTWLGSEFIATGASQDGTGVAWHSPDGLAWTRMDIASVLPGAQVQAAGAVGTRELLFGLHLANYGGRPVPSPSSSDTSSWTTRLLIAKGEPSGQP